MSRSTLLVIVVLAAVSLILIGLNINGHGVPPLAQAQDDPFGGGAPEKPEEPQDDPFGEVAPGKAGDDPFGGVAPAESDENPFGPADVDPSDENPFGTAPVRKAEEDKPAARPKRPTVPLRFGTEAVLEALEENTSLEYGLTTVAEFAELLQEKHRIHVRVSERALDDVGMDPATEVDVSISDVPLRSLLELTLDDLDLTWTIQAGVLLITTQEEAEVNLVTRTYDVSDLLAPTRQYPYQGKGLPTTVPLATPPTSIIPNVGGGMGGGATSGSALNSGGGMFNLAPAADQPRAVLPQMAGDFLCGGGYLDFAATDDSTMDGLSDMIQSTIRPNVWDNVGGDGTCAPFGQSLVISQTHRVHMEIEALLEDLRAKRRGVPTVAVELRWLWLDSETLGKLQGGEAESPIAVDPKMLDELTRTVPGYRGQIVCLSGHCVHLASGNRRSVVTGAIPVVGSGIGYQPTVETPNVGIVAQVRPTVEPGAETVLLDVQSLATCWAKSDPPTMIGGAWPAGEVAEGLGQTVQQPPGNASIAIDRPNIPTQQFATTARLPLGLPVLLGGLTFVPNDDASAQPMPQEEQKQLYLVVKSSVVK